MTSRKLIAVLSILTGMAGWTLIAQAHIEPVPDDVIGHPREQAIRQAWNAGWFQGKDGMFLPDRLLTGTQAGTVFHRAFPGGISRANTAHLIVAGRQALKPAQTETGRLVPADLPVVRIQNLPGYADYSWDDRFGRWIGTNRYIHTTLVEVCHIIKAHPNYRTRNNLKSYCNDLSRTWIAVWNYIPTGFETHNLFVWSEQDGNNAKLPFLIPEEKTFISVSEVEAYHHADVKRVVNLKPLLVRDVTGRTVDVLIECIQYPGWSDEPVSNMDEIETWNCLNDRPEITEPDGSTDD